MVIEALVAVFDRVCGCHIYSGNIAVDLIKINSDKPHEKSFKCIKATPFHLFDGKNEK